MPLDDGEVAMEVTEYPTQVKTTQNLYNQTKKRPTVTSTRFGHFDILNSMTVKC